MLTLNTEIRAGKIIKLVLLNDNFNDKEVNHFSVIVQEVNKPTLERKYKTYSGAARLYNNLIAE